MKITYQPESDGTDAYTVVSESGSTYHVRYCGSGDGDPDRVSIWECDCSAGSRGKMCKHVREVAEIANDEPIKLGAVLRMDRGE